MGTFKNLSFSLAKLEHPGKIPEIALVEWSATGTTTYLVGQIVTNFAIVFEVAW